MHKKRETLTLRVFILQYILMKLAKNDIRRMQAKLYCHWRTDDFKEVGIAVLLASKTDSSRTHHNQLNQIKEIITVDF